MLLAINGHHLILDGIFYSYQFLPMDQFFPNFGEDESVEFIMKLFVAVFAIAFQMSAPIVATLFLVTLALRYYWENCSTVKYFRRWFSD